jgi:hypothetical protein
MSFRLDARVPVVFGSPDMAGPDDVLLFEGGEGLASFEVDQGHAPGCACCTPRRAAGRALAALLQSRARGQVAFFRRVIVVTTSDAGRADIVAALRDDPVASACFRQAP